MPKKNKQTTHHHHQRRRRRKVAVVEMKTAAKRCNDGEVACVTSLVFLLAVAGVVLVASFRRVAGDPAPEPSNSSLGPWQASTIHDEDELSSSSTGQFLSLPTTQALHRVDHNGNGRGGIRKRQIWVDKSKRKPESNLIYIEGSKSYKEALNECKQLGTHARLALLDDLERAYLLGYHNCKRGWLLDKHTGYVVQQHDAPNKCKTDKAGVIYSSTTYKRHKSYGAYCTYRQWFDERKHRRFAPSINLWFRKDPAHLYKLRKDLQKKRTGSVVQRIGSLYPCCNYLNVVPVQLKNGQVVTQVLMTRKERSMRYLVSLSRKVFPETRPKIMPHIRMSYKAMCHYGAGTFNRSSVVEDIVEKAVASKVDGVMFDYEPHHDYTHRHALMVKEFLNLLGDRLHQYGLRLGFCISDWGILKYYEVYAETSVDVFATMSVTYYGSDLEKNKRGVQKLLRTIDPERVQIGIKSSVREPIDPVTGEVPISAYKKPSGWTHRSLKNFVRWLARYTRVSQLHVWPESWGTRSRTRAFFYRTLKKFGKDRVPTPPPPLPKAKKKKRRKRRKKKH